MSLRLRRDRVTEPAPVDTGLPVYEVKYRTQKLEESFTLTVGDARVLVKATDRRVTELTLKQPARYSARQDETLDLLKLGLDNLEGIIAIVRAELSEYIVEARP